MVGGDQTPEQKASAYALKKRAYGRALIAELVRDDSVRLIHEQPVAAMSGVRSLLDTARKRHLRYWGRLGIDVRGPDSAAFREDR